MPETKRIAKMNQVAKMDKTDQHGPNSQIGSNSQNGPTSQNIQTNKKPKWSKMVLKPKWNFNGAKTDCNGAKQPK